MQECKIAASCAHTVVYIAVLISVCRTGFTIHNVSFLFIFLTYCVSHSRDPTV